jgi:hypothetical protein
MKKTLILCMALALAGCATIERHVASYVISRYVGVWAKDGATNDEMAVASSHCVIAQAGRDFSEKDYRACMTAQGWTLKPFELQ